jgi:virginiamycin B lyase
MKFFVKKSVLSLGIWMAALAFVLGTAAGASAADPQPEFSLGPSTRATALTTGPDGNLWFVGTTDGIGGTVNVVGRVTLSGRVTEYQLPFRAPSEVEISSIVTGPDGNLWFAETGANRIGTITPAGQITEFPLPSPGSRPRTIASGPGGHLWVSEEGTNRVARIDTGGSIEEFPLTEGSRPTGVAVRFDGTVWVTEPGVGKYAKISTEGEVAEYPSSSPSGRPGAIVVGPEGHLWFTDADAPRIAHVIPTAGAAVGRETFAVPGRAGTELLVAAGPKGDFWFTEGNRIGSITPNGEAAEPACVAAGCQYPVASLAVGPEGGLWYGTGERATEGGGGGAILAHQEPGRIGRFTPPPRTVALGRRLRPLSGRYTGLRLECHGGAAGESCDGIVRLVGSLSEAPLGSRGFHLRVSTGHSIEIPLNRRATRVLSRRARLPVRGEVTLAGKPAASRRLVLHARCR